MSRSGDNNATSDSEAMSQGLVINILNIVEQAGSCCHADGCCPTDVVSEGDKKIDSDSQINTDTFPS